MPYVVATGPAGQQLVVRTQDGACIPATASNGDYAVYLAWVAAGNTATVAPPAAAINTMTPLVFIARFTPAEQLAITTAGQSSPDILLWLLQCTGASYVDITDAKTITGVQALVSAGLLASSRKPAVLAPP